MSLEVTKVDVHVSFVHTVDRRAGKEKEV